ncbi:MAG: LysM peptidoglycan-binding domain-containing protein [Aquabacterium sp.]|uniref:peptidoglycan DD-metalloendopeptidase family protein n=1 Tax=Aquabacterium sp. TaxID=1872578 RepID=UPI00121962BD|nr:peptidoglycan DD-metalloendopeptidase family protein [Aquabacterium sp.]TAK88682.1 MAG: LysM peptidoglycan-binding domain-containing protein [Aquabacterium sp.]
MHMNFTYRFAAAAALTLVLAGCASTNHHAPVEDRSRAGTPGTASNASATPKVLPGAENAGKPGYYTVKKGDTLIRISLDAGQRWRDLAVWNSLENPNLIEEGQVLRVIPPGADATAVASGAAITKPIGSPKIEARSVDAKGNVVAKTASGVAAAAASGASGAASAAPAASAAAEPKDAGKDKDKDSKDAPAKDADEPAWSWPANGPTLSGFEEGKRKGLAIGGKAGDPVYAAADGSVVYAGSGLRGYGNLIIIKHNGEYLTAYAHNQTLLVKEDQSVRKGQKIAEMGSTDADRVQLHFEIRKRGKPIDPAKQLPSR